MIGSLQASLVVLSRRDSFCWVLVLLFNQTFQLSQLCDDKGGGIGGSKPLRAWEASLIANAVSSLSLSMTGWF